MKTTFLKGTMIITLATLVSKLLGSLFRIPLQNIAGDEVLGIFTLVYPLYMVSLILAVAGIPLAISKLIAEARTIGSSEDIRNIFVTAGILGLLFGAVMFCILVIFSRPISLLMGGTTAQYAIIVVSITLLIAPYMAVYRGYFQGFQEMAPTAISQVIEQLVRVILILVLAWYFVSVHASSQVIAGGIMAGSSLGAFMSLFYLRWLYVRSSYSIKVSRRYQWRAFKIWAKKILKLSIPIAVGSLTMALLNLVDSLTIPLSLSFSDVGQNVHDLYGLYGRGLAVVQIATVFATSLVLPLIPSVTESLAKGDNASAGKVVSQSQRFNHFVTWPAALGLLVLAYPVNLSLFGDERGTWVIALLGFSSLFQAFTVLGTGILQGINLDRLAAWIVVFGVVIKMGLNVWLATIFGLLGAAISTLVVYLLLAIIIAAVLNHYFHVRILPKGTFVFIIGSVVMSVVISVPVLLLGDMLANRLMSILYLFAAVLFGALLYLFIVLKFGGIQKEEFASIPVINRFVKQNVNQ